MQWLKKEIIRLKSLNNRKKETTKKKLVFLIYTRYNIK